VWAEVNLFGFLLAWASGLGIRKKEEEYPSGLWGKKGVKMKVKMMMMRMMRRAAPVLPSLVMDVVVGFVHGDACALIGLCPHLGLEYLPPQTTAHRGGESVR
jgi:hypothetical protein